MDRVHEDDTTAGAVCTPGEARPGMVLAVLAAGTVMAPLDSSIVQIALPAIAARFDARLAAVSWVTTAYLLTTAALLLPMGRAGDIWGLRRLYVAGLFIFGAASALCATALSLPHLVAARTLQAVGASMLFAAGPALITRTFSPARRGWALGYISLAVSAGLTAGPALGGFLVGTFGWPSIFIVNVPLSASAAIAAWRMLPTECPEPRRFDALGALLAGAALYLLLGGLGRIDESGLFGADVGMLLAGAVASGSAFVAWEKRARDPLVDLSMFANRGFTTGVVAATLAYLSLFSLTFTMPFYLVRIHQLDPRFAGLLLTVTPLSMALFAPTAGRLSDKHGSRGLTTAGISVLALGLFCGSLLTPQTPVHLVALVLAAVGSGMAVFQTPNTAAILGATPHERAGVGSAFVAEARNLGMSLGIALAAAIVSSALGGRALPADGTGLQTDLARAFMSGMSAALRTGAALSLAGAALSWFGRGPGAVEAPGSRP